MSNYRVANATTQWFQDAYPGATLNLSEATSVVVLHTTEGATWPDYDGGAKAPNYTAKPNFTLKVLEWRAHFPDEKSSRALVNLAGGVETNTLNAVQVELVGTCDPRHRIEWVDVGRAGVDYVFWPDAPDWCLLGVAKFLADQHKRHGLQLTAPAFLPYPSSYGDSAGRFTPAQWSTFAGVCGHQHVPENLHGDPGNLDVARILDFAKRLTTPRTFKVGYAHRCYSSGFVYQGHNFFKLAHGGITSHRDQKAVRLIAKAARTKGNELILIGPSKGGLLFNPARLAKQLDLKSFVHNDVRISFSPSVKVVGVTTTKITTLFELEKA